MAVVVLMNTTGNLDPGAVASDRAGEVFPWPRPTRKPFADDAAPLLGEYEGPSRGRDMVVEATQTLQGIADAPPRADVPRAAARVPRAGAA